MKRSELLNKMVVIFLFVLLIQAGAQAQDFNSKEVFKKYVQKDSASINNGALLIFFTDHTYVNFGVLNDTQNNEMYVWYASGEWLLKDSEIKCKTVYTSLNHQKTIDGIKFYYRQRPDYRLIASYYEFVCERYTDYSIFLIKNKAIDLTKKIEYLELKNPTILNN